MTRNLGRAVSILKRFEDHQNALHDDVSAFGAPSECHDLVNTGGAKRFRLVRKHACAVAGVKNLKQLRALCKARVPSWDRYNYHRLGIMAI